MPGGIRPVADWPKLLAGPMVRRVTAQRAHIWVCTKTECSAQVVLYNGGDVQHGAAGEVAAGPRVTLDRLGEKMFMGVLQVDFPAGSPAGSTFSYDVIVREGTTDRGLFQLGLLGGTAAQLGDQFDALRVEVPLGYEVGRLPSFVTPVDHPSALRFVHASCRKPHGGQAGEPDALELVDCELADIAAGRTAASERPQQLILTGDQIYADDVAPGLLAALTEAGDTLLGWTEDIPTIIPLTSFLIDPGWRTRFLAIDGIDLKELPPDNAADYSASHLLRFGEWCAMYLFAWSDALWKTELDPGPKYTLPAAPATLPVGAIQTALDVADQVGVIVMPARATKVVEEVVRLSEFVDKLTKHWTETNEKVLGYAHSVRAVRRAMANVATYTMFDDHEITDDWYLSKRVHDRLKGVGATGAKADVGPRLLRNGLSAYTFFQHWGNQPEDFEPGRNGSRLLDKWRFTTGPNGCLLRGTPRNADTLLAITPGDSPIPASRQRHDFSRMRWDYAIDFPSHRLVVLDTRTWRFFPTSDPMSWASLAPMLPGPAGTPQTSGAKELAAIAAEWRRAGTAANQVVMRSLADMIDAYCALASNIRGSRSAIETRFRAVVTAVDSLLGEIPGRAALSTSAVVDPITSFINEFVNNPTAVTSLFASMSDSEVVETIVQSLHDAADFDFGPASDQLTLLFGALADFVDVAVTGSAGAMAFSARRAATEAGDGLWQILTTLPTTHPANLRVVAAVQLALGALDTLTQAVGIDQLASAIFRNGDNRLGPGLIREDAMVFMVTEPLAVVGPTRVVTLVLSPAPIFGNRLVEVAQKIKVVQLIAQGKAGEEELDFEAWTCNIPAMINLFEAARSLTCAIVLSGDVHYAGSSVNQVRTRHANTRYVQLTSSSARNSDSMTRGLALLDDLVYDDAGRILFLQSDWPALMQAGSSGAAPLQNLARDRVDRLLDDMANAVDVQRQYENLVHWWRSSAISLDDVAETVGRVVTAAPNTVRAVVTEAAWEIYSGIEMIQSFADDPLLAMFGDFLTAGPALRGHLRDFYREVGIDPEHGLNVDSTTIVDRRPVRLATYPAHLRYAPTSAAFRLANDKQRRTVGNANAGFVELATRGNDILEVKHELRWYPIDDPERHQEPVTRVDWMGTLHRLGWNGITHDVARGRGGR